jgi:hypothetical protein
LYRTASAQFS